MSIRSLFRLWKFAALSLMALALLSCENEKEFLTLSGNSIQIPPDGGQVTFTVSSNTSWTITSAESWATANPASGEGETLITVTADGNGTGTNRNATLTVASAAATQTVTLSQAAASLALNPSRIVFDAAGTPMEVTVTANCNWTLTIQPEAEWCRASSLSGTGNQVVTLTPTPYAQREVRNNATLTFAYLNGTADLTIRQQIDNEVPSAPVLTAPGNDSRQTTFPVQLTWTASTDPDGDDLTYAVYLSADGQNWGEAIGETDETRFALDHTTVTTAGTYSWKILAKDPFGGTGESEVRSFTFEFYADGEVSTYQTFSAADVSVPVHVVIVGDGFVEADYATGGAFDRAAEQAAEAFFSVEPFPSYRNYFTVYKVVAYSQERGATVLRDFEYAPLPRQNKKTVFNSQLDGGSSTGISCDTEAVFDYVLKVPALAESDLANTAVILIINLDVYAGSCYMWSSGKNLAMCPTGDTFTEIVYHEGGGHGFGRLLDEYVYYATESYPANDIYTLNSFRADNVWSFGANLSLTADPDEVHWKHYFAKVGYDMVGLYEGADSYGKGVWRPEENSCMDDNVPYFNAASREAIVRRIMSINGKGFDYDAFYAKDDATYPVTAGVRSAVGPAAKPPLAPPKLMP